MRKILFSITQFRKCNFFCEIIRCAISIDDSLYHNTPVLNNQTTIINNEDVDSCHYLGPDNETVPCNSWLYDQTYYQSSLVIEWDAVCNRRWMAAVTQSAFMFGVFLGSILLGNFQIDAFRPEFNENFYISNSR